MVRTTAGPLLRDWRLRRRRSQMDLALEVGVSPRHLSFVETGRSRPSPELLLALAECLEVPLRARNSFLLAAGYAPRFRRTPLSDPAMAQVRSSLETLLRSHEPYPGVVIDRAWNIVVANAAVKPLLAVLPDALVSPSINVFRACLHPEGLAPHTLNFAEWATYLLTTLHRLDELDPDPDIQHLVDEVHNYPTVRALGDRKDRAHVQEHVLLVPWRLSLAGNALSFFTTLTTFGTPRDITIEELAVELFYPEDAATEDALRGSSSNL